MGILKQWWNALTKKNETELQPLATKRPGYAASNKNNKPFVAEVVITVNGHPISQHRLPIVKAISRDAAAKRVSDSISIKLVSVRPFRKKKIVNPEQLHK